VQKLGREPSPEELAAALGWCPQQVARLEALAQETTSLNTRVGEANDRTELGDLLSDTRFDPEAESLSTTLRDDLAAAMARLLTQRERRFLRAYYGFETGQKATLEQVGVGEGLTRERAREVIAGALAKLRDDPAVAAYRELFVGG
jgi:RNA polymerase primary sigma factor